MTPMDRSRRSILVWAAALAPPALWAGAICFGYAYEDRFLRLTREDGIIENTQTLLFAVGAVLAWLIACRVAQDGSQPGPILLYCAIGAALFWITGEEISWGQRLLGLPTPPWFAARNTQGEMNIHNLPWFMAVVGGVRTYGLLALSAASLIGWLAAGTPARRRALGLWLPHPVVIPAWLCVASYSGLRRLYMWRHPETERISIVLVKLQEVAELILAAGIVASLLIVCRQMGLLGGPAHEGDR